MEIVNIKVKSVEGLRLPEQSRPFDAGYDVFASTEPKIKGDLVKVEGYDNVNMIDVYSDIRYIEYGTGLFVAPEDTLDFGGPFSMTYQKYWTMLFPRSSISKYNLTLCNSFATIDNGYRGEILLRYKYVPSPSDYVLLKNAAGQFYGVGVRVNMEKIYKRGDAIAQMTAFKNVSLRFNVVDDIGETSRGDGGFGSSGNNSVS